MFSVLVLRDVYKGIEGAALLGSCWICFASKCLVCSGILTAKKEPKIRSKVYGSSLEFICVVHGWQRFQDLFSAQSPLSQ